jgi:High-affinity nickel-transport protein
MALPGPWALLTFAGQPTLLGTALLADTLGLRHAVDADHIAAIDNVVRELMQADRGHPMRLLRDPQRSASRRCPTKNGSVCRELAQQTSH